MGATAAPRGGAEGEKCQAYRCKHTQIYIYTDVCAADLVLEKSVQVESVNKCKVNTHRLKYFTDVTRSISTGSKKKTVGPATWGNDDR